MAKNELQISIIMLWESKYNRNGKLTPKVIDFSISKDNYFIEEVSHKKHMQLVKVPSKFFTMDREKQLKFLEKLADIEKIQKFKTVKDLIAELQNCYSKDALVKVLYYSKDDDELHYAPVQECYDGGYGDCFEIEIAQYEC